jgi:hypothetical protein
MIERLASMAPASPPLTGASSTRTPASRPASLTRTATSGRMVLMSMYSAPDFALANTPSSPPVTASTSGESGTMVITTSASRTAPATSSAPRPPASTNRCTRSGDRLYPTTS